MPGFDQNISIRVYGALLLAYPPEFRRDFGNEMLQVFRDSYRAEARSGSLPGFWFRTLWDLAVTAVKERTDRSGKEDLFMNRRSELIALLGCAAIIIVAFLLLSYGRKNEVGPILMFGHVLDALVTTGVIGNVIVFLFNKTTKLNPLRTALWTFAIVHVVLLALVLLFVSRIDPTFNAGRVLIGYVVSFVVWATLHFALRRRPEVYS